MLIMNKFMFKLFQDFFTPTSRLSKKLDCVSLGPTCLAIDSNWICFSSKGSPAVKFLGVSCLLEALPWGDCTCAEWVAK